MKAHNGRTSVGILAVGCLFMAGGAWLDLHGSRDATVMAAYVTAILLTLRCRNSAASLFVAGMCMGLVITGYFLAVPAGPAWKEVGARLFGVYALGVTGALTALYQRLLLERSRLLEERAHALTKMETLSQLIPICSACHKVRDDKGSWEKLEAYIRQHFDARFSHSLCPECAAQLYPKFAKRMIEEKRRLEASEAREQTQATPREP